MDLRRLYLLKDVVCQAGGRPLERPVTRIAACAVLRNPAARRESAEAGDLIALGAELGERLTAEALALLERPVAAYGKAAMVGTEGQAEHAAAILHPRMGKPIRAGIGGGKAVIPSNAKVCAAGSTIDVPIGHKDDSWSFDEIDTIGVAVPGSPLPDEVVVVLVFSDGGRPRCIP